MSSAPRSHRENRWPRPGYGWVIVVVAAWAMVATLPGRTHGLGMITERLLADERFDLDRVSYSNLNWWATVLGACFCWPCGRLMDRFGLRLMLVVTVSALAGAVFWMTRAADATTLFLAILLTRGFGQSALSVISITMVGKWFPGRLSLPMAVYSLLLSLGFAYSAQLAKPFATADWRELWEGIGFVLAAGVPLCWFLTREASAAAPAPAAGSGGCCGAPRTDQPAEFTLRQAMGTSAFWVFGLAISLVALIGSGTSLFNESVLKEQGFSIDAYYNLITLTGTVSLLTKLPIGWLGQSLPLNRLLTAGLILQSVCLAALPRVHSPGGITAYGIGMGVSGTITTVLFFTIWSQAYGQAHLGQIQSVAQMMTVLASAAGPRLFADCFSRFGSYAGIFHLLSALTAGVAVWAWRIRVPDPREAVSPAAAPAALPRTDRTCFQEVS
jgi:MFS family permease